MGGLIEKDSPPGLPSARPARVFTCLRLISAFFLMMSLLAVLPAAVSAQSSGEVVLPGDEATTQTWRAVRMRLGTHTSPLRQLVRQSRHPEGLTAAVKSLEKDLDLFQSHARALAIEESAAIQTQRSRIEKLLDHLVYDYANGDGTQFGTTLGLLDESLARLEDLAIQADIRIGRRGWGRYAALPPDWAPPRYPESIIRPDIAVMDGREICEAIQVRLRAMKGAPRDRVEDDAEVYSREIGEFARALILRQGEVLPASRPGFRNTALQMDVIAENQVDLLRKGDWTNFRRQLIALDEALDKAFLYLNMNL